MRLFIILSLKIAIAAINVAFTHFITIWPISGVANQLLATLALCIGTTIVLKRHKRWSYALITLVPMIVLFITTVTAGTMSIVTNYWPKGMILNSLLVGLIIVALITVVIDSALRWSKIIK